MSGTYQPSLPGVMTLALLEVRRCTASRVKANKELWYFINDALGLAIRIERARRAGYVVDRGEPEPILPPVLQPSLFGRIGAA